MVLHKIVETVRSDRRPSARDMYDEIADGRENFTSKVSGALAFSAEGVRKHLSNEPDAAGADSLHGRAGLRQHDRGRAENNRRGK